MYDSTVGFVQDYSSSEGRQGEDLQSIETFLTRKAR